MFKKIKISKPKFNFHNLKEKFIKHDFISYYKEEDKYLVLKNRFDNDEFINVENNEFSKEELIEYIKHSFLKNSLTYVSTIVNTMNQGVVNSCSHIKYKELGIDVNDVKILCIEKKFSIYLGIYDFGEIKQENDAFNYDFLYSIYILIYKNGITKNSLYVLTFKEYIVLMIVNETPIYGDIYYFKQEKDIIDTSTDLNPLSELDDDLFGDIDDIEEIDELDDLSDDIEEEADYMEEHTQDNDDEKDISSKETLEESISEIKDELETIEFIKESLKNYYQNYGDEFIENIFVLSNYEISENLAINIEKEILIETKLENVDILKIMNLISKEEIYV